MTPRPTTRRMRRTGATRSARDEVLRMDPARLRYLIQLRWYRMLGRDDVVAEWRRDFERFLAWARPRFRCRLCLERIDESKPFGPSNCRFFERGEIVRRAFERRNSSLIHGS